MSSCACSINVALFQCCLEYMVMRYMCDSVPKVQLRKFVLRAHKILGPNQRLEPSRTIYTCTGPSLVCTWSRRSSRGLTAYIFPETSRTFKTLPMFISSINPTPFTIDQTLPFQYPFRLGKKKSKGRQNVVHAYLPPPPPIAEINNYAYSDHSETAEAHVFTFELPGVKKGEVKVSVVNGRVLEVIAGREVEKAEENDTWHLVERGGGRFWQKIRLPEGARVEQMKAAMEDGVLTVTVPKVEVKELDVKSVDVSG